MKIFTCCFLLVLSGACLQAQPPLPFDSIPLSGYEHYLAAPGKSVRETITPLRRLSHGSIGKAELTRDGAVLAQAIRFGMPAADSAGPRVYRRVAYLDPDELPAFAAFLGEAIALKSERKSPRRVNRRILFHSKSGLFATGQITGNVWHLQMTTDPNRTSAQQTLTIREARRLLKWLSQPGLAAL